MNVGYGSARAFCHAFAARRGGAAVAHRRAACGVRSDRASREQARTERARCWLRISRAPERQDRRHVNTAASPVRIQPQHLRGRRVVGSRWRRHVWVDRPGRRSTHRPHRRRPGA